MAQTPLFKRGDVVYLKGSAVIGQLDSFEISGAEQRSAGVWLYQVKISKRPPATRFVGDQYDGRLRENDLLYAEGELIGLCEALDLIISNLTNQLTSVEANIANECSELPPIPIVGAPKFNIDDMVFISSSARIGFFECRQVQSVREIGVQPGSKQARFIYALKNLNQEIIFREDELLTKCEAAVFVKNYLERRLSDTTALDQASCP